MNTEQIKELRAQVKTIASTESGIAFFRYLMDECGYKRPTVVIDSQSGEVNVRSTMYNEARRGLWLDLRKLFIKQHVNMIEMER